MQLLETYLRELYEIRSTGAGVKETSYYPALSKLLNEVGKPLKPRVLCVIHLQDRGAGLPDGGLFTADQFNTKSDAKPREGQLPSRGAIEVKPVGDDAWLTAESAQVTRYWKKYRQVLVTNYRDFVLVAPRSDGKPTKVESFRLAESEKDFWSLAAHPRKTAAAHNERFIEFLKRILQYKATLASPEEVAWFLASYAHDALRRIEGADIPALVSVRDALAEALGLKIEDEKGEHFFRSALVQTLFYGVFSAWVFWAKKHPPTERKARFDWRLSVYHLSVPVLRTLFHELTDPSRLRELKLAESLDLAGAVLNRVDRASFFERFQQEHAVQYFYEPFLKHFDPQLRKDLGVYYTPPEIVTYIVERVDRVLRDELNLSDGLADPNVFILDPCCGTGSFLVEAVRRIHRTIEERGADALTAAELKQAVRERIFGFEILPAPFVVAHLQMGLLLQSLGAPLSEEKQERAGVYLTNALTGWEPPKGPKQRLPFPEFEEEREAAEHVKRDAKILVVLGNPPYDAFAGVSPAEEHGLVEPYKEGVFHEWGIKKFNLDDYYVRFFRLAERRIAEMTGRGVVCYISNFSYLGDPSFVVMRKRFLEEFDRLWFDCMNGDSRETGKLTPEGELDPSVFSTDFNRQGIRKGTAIGLLVRRGKRDKKPTVRFRHFWGVTKRADLVASLDAKDFDAQYQLAQSSKANRFSFRPSKVAAHYLEWPTIDLLADFHPTLGILENRKESLISIDRVPLEERMKLYCDSEEDWKTLKALNTGLTQDFARFDAKKTRQKILDLIKQLKKEKRDFPHSVRPLLIRPMDTRWCYYTPVRPLWNEPRPDYYQQCWDGNFALVTRRKGVASPEGTPFFYTSSLGYQHALNTDAYYVPILLLPKASFKSRKNANQNQGSLSDFLEQASTHPAANLSVAARTYLAKLEIKKPDADAKAAGLIWMHALAIGYSPAYLSENADGIRENWPRIPLPKSKKLLLASAELGEQVAALLNTEAPGKGVTSGKLRPEIKVLAVPTRVGGGPLRENGKDLALTAGWGHAGKGGVTMPGKGKVVERDYTEQERTAIAEGAKTLGLSVNEAFARLGKTTCDIFLNDDAFWTNIPCRVWEYHIGGYQVIKKWLSYREARLLGRSLKRDEVREVQNMTRRLAALLLLEPALDANYRRVRDHAYAWGDTKP